MEKIINIDGREVKLKTNGAFLFRYKEQFHRDALRDLTTLAKIKEDNMEELEIVVFYNFFWTMARAANPEIPPLKEYLETFDEFPILDILPDIVEMAMLNLQSAKKK